MEWQDVYKQLDPKKPLSSHDERLEKKLYLNDFFNTVKDITVLNCENNAKLLLSGHTGCGKSTFLNLLADDDKIKKEFFPVKYSISELLNPEDIDHIDIMLSIVVQTLVSLPEEKIKKVDALVKKVEELALRLQSLVEEVEETSLERDSEIGGEGAFGLSFGFLKSKLFSTYKLNDQSRKTVRTHYKTKISDFIFLINSVMGLVETHLKKKLLILIDDTDKIALDRGLEVFYTNGHHLSAIDANIVYVIDLSITTSSKYPAIRGKFDAEEFFPAVKIMEKDNKTINEKNMKIFKEIAGKRIPGEFIDDEVLAEAVICSGGVIREFLRILNYAVFNAKGKIREDSIEHARVKIANQYNLKGDDTKLLFQILKDPDYIARELKSDTEEILLDLLHIQALFQYRNGDIKWYRPHPVFIDWLYKLHG
ncbi:MAG: hypothetical protein GY754_15990 [bacterium]|nr:hypothetical protein [bacterium]